MALTALAVCIMALSTPVQAGLTWERREAAATAKPSDTQLEVVYPFKNTGDVPVSITSVRTSCGCTSATPDRTTYAPGEEGRLTASVQLGDRSGRQNYSIRVLTDDGGDAVILKLKATIPKLLEVSPRIIRWRKGADRTPQSTTIRVLHDEPIRVVKVECDDPGFKAEFRTVAEGGQYEVVVTPPAVGEERLEGKTVTAAVAIHTEGPGGSERVYTVYANVDAPFRAPTQSFRVPGLDEGANASASEVVNRRMRIAPRLVYWRWKEPHEPKTIELEVVGKTPLTVTSIISSDPSLPVELREVEAGRRYVIEVSPLHRDDELRSELNIEAADAEGNTYAFKAYARVVGPEWDTARE